MRIIKKITFFALLSVCLVSGCTRVVRTDYTTRPVIDPHGHVIGERVDAHTSSVYVPDF